MHGADHYKKLANDCLERARRADSDPQRKAFLELAIDRQTKQLVVAARTSKIEWTRDDAIKAFGQGWGLFTAYGNKVMRVLCIDGKPITGIDLKPRVMFRTDELARAWVKQRATAGSDLHRRAWALDGKTNREAQD